MSAIASQILHHLEHRAAEEGVPLDQTDEFVAAELGLPVRTLHAYLLLCFAAERYANDRGGTREPTAAEGW